LVMFSRSTEFIDSSEDGTGPARTGGPLRGRTTRSALALDVARPVADPFVLVLGDASPIDLQLRQAEVREPRRLLLELDGRDLEVLLRHRRLHLGAHQVADEGVGPGPTGPVRDLGQPV